MLMGCFNGQQRELQTEICASVDGLFSLRHNRESYKQKFVLVLVLMGCVLVYNRESYKQKFVLVLMGCVLVYNRESYKQKLFCASSLSGLVQLSCYLRMVSAGCGKQACMAPPMSPFPPLLPWEQFQCWSD